MGWTEKLRLNGLAEEDIYFARRDRELIEALHQQESAKQRQAEKRKEKKATKD